MDKFLCCGEECTKKLECGHTCKLICHPGNCRPISECKTKVKKSCACRFLKAKFICSDAPEKIECNESCKINKQNQLEKQQALEAKQKEKEKQRELETNLNQTSKKKPKSRKPKSIQETKKDQSSGISLKLKNFFSTITSEQFWKVAFVYALPFIFLFVFVLLTLLKN